MNDRLEVTILGCGSSGGVPRGNGDWGACDPAEPRNRRRRCSLAVRRLPATGEGEATTVLVDTSPDLREQALAAGLKRVDGVLYTHDHADQVHGVDDLRTFAALARRRVPTWMDAATRTALERRFAYIFNGENGYPAICEAVDLPPWGAPFEIMGPSGPVPATAFAQGHGPIGSAGYRFGPVAYSPDVDRLDDAAFAVLQGARLWIVDALRWTRHPTHAHLDRTLGWIARAGIERAVLTNLHIDMDYNQLASLLPAAIEPAYDGWRTELPLS